MLQIISLYLNRDIELQFTITSGREFQNIYSAVAKLIVIIIYAKTFHFKVVASRIGIGNIKESVNF